MRNSVPFLLAGALLIAGCWRAGGGGSGAPDGGDTATDTDVDGDADGDTDSDADPDTETCADLDPPPGCVRYVNRALGGSWDGLSWCTALETVQEGIAAAREALVEDPDLGTCQVWVAAGTYHATSGGDPEETIALAPGVLLYGGFAGDEETLDARDWIAHETVLTGEPAWWQAEHRAYHVVTGSDDALIDGFTITGGHADGINPHTRGGGMANWSASPTVRNCTFSDNYALEGGALLNQSSSPAIEDCVFELNNAEYFGGAISNNAGAPQIARCVFRYNDAFEHGGAIADASSSPTISDSLFLDNWAASAGGAVSNSFGAPLFERCVFRGNEVAAGPGGAVDNPEGGAPTFRGCLFFDNFAAGGTLRNGASTYTSIVNCSFLDAGGGTATLSNESGSQVVIYNSILWDSDSTAPIDDDLDALVLVSHSDVKGGYPGLGNLDADPLFFDGEDYDLHLQAGSPCIDAADGDAAPAQDLDGNPPVDDPDTPDTGSGDPPYADIGAYEYLP